MVTALCISSFCQLCVYLISANESLIQRETCTNCFSHTCLPAETNLIQTLSKSDVQSKTHHVAFDFLCFAALSPSTSCFYLRVFARAHSIPTRFIKTKALSVARFGFFQFPRRQRYFSKVLSVPAELCGCVSGWFHILPFPDMLLLFRFYVHLCYVPCCVAPCSLYAYLFICLFSPRYRVCALVRFLGPTILRPQSYHHSFSSVWNELIYFIYFPHFYHNASLQASSPHTHTPSADGYLEIQPAQSEQCRPATKQILYVAVCYRIHVAYFSKEASTRTRKQRKQTPATVW